MDEAIKTVLTWLLTQGWVGLLTIGQFALIWDMRKELALARSRIAELQDKWVSDSQEMTREVTEAIGSTRDTIQVAVDMMNKERRGR